MKTKQILTAITILLVVFSCKNRQSANIGAETTAPVQTAENKVSETNTFHKYGIKSGIVTFETDMMGMKIKSVLYFDDYGIKEADEKYNGDNIASISICDGKERYNIFPSKKIAYSEGSCYRGVAYRFAWDEVSKEDQLSKGKKLPNINIAGKDCESFSIDLGTSLSVYTGWQNICLSLKTSSGGTNVIMQATKIEENAEIPATKFKVPEGYEIKKAGAF
jgi:hypothetical protein